jgi:hypothetical protein
MTTIDVHPIAQELFDMAKYTVRPSYRGTISPFPAGISEDHRSSLRLIADRGFSDDRRRKREVESMKGVHDG